ncbi:cocaine- and amphetamine-regulated transcript 2 isoform X1 [Acanthopagrus latus]|uniref:cocaine- and amphetamine-regulated transcript 2 isoform X1 n=1 Tax=Acanthopagrus latus TaxID=8177 RepID=UPI00187C5D78|nr:cocaine- and amphetamine-regulated transcript 2 isoform X1 [Acanthopagrus latus]
MLARAVLCAALLSALCPAGRTEAERDERDVQDYHYSNSNRLVSFLITAATQQLGALHEVLEKLQTKRINPWEKKYGQVPSCDLGEHCAVRKGSRIGKMCDCPQGAFCNFFLLKCL